MPPDAHQDNTDPTKKKDSAGSWKAGFFAGSIGFSIVKDLLEYIFKGAGVVYNLPSLILSGCSSLCAGFYSGVKIWQMKKDIQEFNEQNNSIKEAIEQLTGKLKLTTNDLPSEMQPKIQRIPGQAH